MKYFHYKGLRKNKLVIKGWVLSGSRDEAISHLESKGIHLYTIQEAQGKIKLNVSLEQLLTTFYELASLRNSGMALDKSLAILAESAQKNTAWEQVSTMVRSGMSLSEAMLSLPDAFPRYSVFLIKIGEANGELGSALTVAAEKLAEELKLRNEIRTALMYPSFLILVSLSVLVFLFLSVIPSFSGIVDGMGDNISPVLLLLIKISQWMQEYILFWMVSLFAGVSYLVYLYQAGKLNVWQFVQKINLIKPLVEAWEVVEFCSNMQRLLQQRVQLLEAISLSAETLNREELRLRLQQVKELVQQGYSFGDALKKQNLFTPLAVRMIATGEMTATLPETMKEISHLYQRRLDEGIKRFLSLLEPIIIFTMGIMVGGIMVSLMSAIISINDIPI